MLWKNAEKKEENKIVVIVVSVEIVENSGNVEFMSFSAFSVCWKLSWKVDEKCWNLLNVEKLKGVESVEKLKPVETVEKKQDS